MNQPPVPARVCPGCGATNRPGVTFCHECGEPLTGATQDGARRADNPPREPVPTRRWEVGIALALILGVLGYSLFDGEHRELQARQYHAGDTAVSLSHWDEAVAVFGALGDYRDSVRRKADAAVQAGARDRAYHRGMAAAGAHNIIAAYRAFSETLAIQPDYRDAPTLFAAAQQALPHAALADTIYRRVSGGTPGLYLYRAEGGDLRLPGSDGRSIIRSFGTDNAPLVYDGPVPDLTAPAPPPPFDSDGDNIRQLDVDRRLLMVDPATLGAGAQVTPTGLPPALGAYGVLLANSHLLWDPAGSSPPPRYSLGEVRGIMVDKAQVYDLATGQSTNLSQSSDQAYVLLGWADAAWQHKWLLGRYNAALEPLYQTTLYLLGEAGGQPQHITEVAGVVYQAYLSADGRFALYTSSTSDLRGTSSTLDLSLMDLADPAHPTQTLASMPVDSVDSAASLQARFVPGGGTPRVLIRRVVAGRQAGSQMQLDLWDGTNTQHLWDKRLGSLRAGSGYTQSGYTQEAYWLAPDGQSLTITVPNRDGTAHLLWLALDGSRPAQEVPLPTGDSETWWPIFPGAAESGQYRLYYGVDRQNSRTISSDTLLYGVPASDPAPPPVLLTTLTAGVDYSTALLALPSGLYAVKTADDTFQVRTLDNALTLPALPGIDLILARPTVQLYPTLLYP